MVFTGFEERAAILGQFAIGKWPHGSFDDALLNEDILLQDEFLALFRADTPEPWLDYRGDVIPTHGCN